MNTVNNDADNIDASTRDSIIIDTGASTTGICYYDPEEKENDGMAFLEIDEENLLEELEYLIEHASEYPFFHEGIYIQIAA